MRLNTTRRSGHGCVALPLLAMLPWACAAAAGVQGTQDGPTQRALDGATPMREVLVSMAGEADLSGLRSMPAGRTRAAMLVARKRAVADASQRDLLRWLRDNGVEHRPYWLVNAVWVRAPEPVLAQLGRRLDVNGIAANPQVALQRVPASQAGALTAKATNAIAWGVARVRADRVWSSGERGEGVVVAGADTGYEWDHPALIRQYRGYDGDAASHAYHWHDAIHASHNGSTPPCGVDQIEPCDDDGHGTHTMGTMVGDDGDGQQVGIAPGARWIGCRNMERGVGTPASYIECFQWFVAPTDLAGQNADPGLAPAVINNSWTCTTGEGCDAGSTALLQQAVDAADAAGILVVASVGNSGSSCGSVNPAPGAFATVFSVGATDVNDVITGFSSRGPTADGRLKPEISAPGSQVYSAWLGGGYRNLSGTSMAAPHVAGVTALLVGANPALAGDRDALRALIQGTAVPRTSNQNCGAFPGSVVPNAVYGSGRLDAYAAFQLAVGQIHVDGFE